MVTTAQAAALAVDAEAATQARIDAAVAAEVTRSAAAAATAASAATASAASAAAEAAELAATATAAAVAQAVESATAAATAAAILAAAAEAEAALEEAALEEASVAAAKVAAAAAAGALNPATSELSTKVDKLAEQLALLVARVNADAPNEDTIEDPRGPKLTYLNPRGDDVHQRIEIGFDKLPPHGASHKPHLYDLHGEPTYDRLQAKEGARQQQEEYLLLYCTTFSLSVALKSLNEALGDALSQDTHDSAILKPILNTLGEAENWYRKRLAFIRAKESRGIKDSTLIEYLKSEIYGELNSTSLGSAPNGNCPAAATDLPPKKAKSDDDDVSGR
mmetsp:Transcript_29814/g.73899  ORF Transcript_29814/g.73899 Transcript_29814/m.73899 type:complete len:335 (-) Transcript_29814:877-1881(-)